LNTRSPWKEADALPMSHVAICTISEPAAFWSCDRESPSLNIMDSAGIEHEPHLTESGRSTNEPWRLFLFGDLRMPLKTPALSCFCGFFQQF
jgi:hypothetical protein